MAEPQGTGPPYAARWSPSATASTTTRLEKVIAIPGTTSSRHSPFLRAYPSVLASSSISQAAFLEFLDNLNRVAAKSPPLQALSLAGDIVGFVPLATTQIVGTVVSIVAEVGTAAVAYGRTEMELRKANKEMFGLAGLKVEVAKLDAVAKLTAMPILDDKGTVDKSVTILEPIDPLSMSLDVQQRRLNAMQPWIAPLLVQDVLPASTPTGAFNKLQAKLRQKEEAKAQQKTIEKRQKLDSRYELGVTTTRREFAEEVAALNEKLDEELKKVETDVRKARVNSQPEKVQEQLDKLDKKRCKAQEKHERKLEKSQQDLEENLEDLKHDKRKGDKEEKSMREILWLIIRKMDETDEFDLIRECRKLI